MAALWVAARHPDRLTLLVVLAVLALAFFALPTRVHERYGFPFFALGAILFAISPRWRVAYVVLAIATFANMYVVLTTLYPPKFPDQNAVRDWLAIGPFLRSQAAVTIVAIMHTAAFVWALLQLRAGARERLADELAEARLVDDVARTTDPSPARASWRAIREPRWRRGTGGACGLGRRRAPPSDATAARGARGVDPALATGAVAAAAASERTPDLPDLERARLARRERPRRLDPEPGSRNARCGRTGAGR